jgi:CxxC motif-containing protein (DUF1111 family)
VTPAFSQLRDQTVQRTFFLHDGRTTDLLQAIRAHRYFRFRPSEANAVIDSFERFDERDKQATLKR